jgi:hypothetical protein
MGCLIPSVYVANPAGVQFVFHRVPGAGPYRNDAASGIGVVGSTTVATTTSACTGFDAREY